MENTDGYLIIYNGKILNYMKIDIDDDNYDETFFFNIKNSVVSILKVRMYEHDIRFHHPVSGFFFRLVDGKPQEVSIDDYDTELLPFYVTDSTDRNSCMISSSDDIYYSCDIYTTDRIIYYLLDNMRINIPKLWYYFTSDINKLYSIPHCLSNHYFFGDTITILMAAAYALNFNLVKYLIENMEANIEIISGKGLSVLIYLFYGLEKYCKYNDRNDEMIENFEKILDFLLEHGCMADIVYTHKKICYPHSDMLNLYDSLTQFKYLSKDILNKIYMCMGEPSKDMVKIEEKKYIKNYITGHSLR
jgi:hypothetical protein